MRKIKIIARHQGEQLIPHLDYYAVDPPMRRWLPLGEVVEVNALPEWLTEIKAGVVIAADEATAKRAGVAFDSKAVEDAKAPPVPAKNDTPAS